MWSGSNSEQWGMNPMSYVGMPNEQVDWASLAQQWIKMKEENPQADKEEGGEAPMEITKEDGPGQRENDWMAPHNSDTTATWGTAGWTWDQAGAWMQWAGAAPGAPTSDMATAAAGYTTGPGYTSVPEPPAIVPPAPVYPYSAPPAQPPAAVEPYNRGYWTGSAAPEAAHTRWDSGGSRKKNISAAPAETALPELDAAKRRALPAWIREGLEKMEREKQKKAEQERLAKLKKEEAIDQAQNPAGSDAVPLNGAELAGPLKKSKFDTESEGEEEEAPRPRKEVLVEPASVPRRSRFDQTEYPPAQPPPKPKRTKEQILQAVMTDVRRILTQILMEVTTEEIEKAVEETHKQFKKKAPAATLRKTPALASLTGKLGLGIYETDSGSESEPEKVTNEPDSDQELRDRIEKLKNDFVRVEEDIEREAAELEERERKQLVKNQPQTVDEPSSPPSVEDQVQPSREGSAASRNDKHSPHKNSREEAKSVGGAEVKEPKAVQNNSKDRRRESNERKSVSREPKRESNERRVSKERRIDTKTRRSSEGSKSSKSERKSESSRSSSSESSSSSSSESEDSSSPSPRRDKKRHKRHHHHHHKKSKKRYSSSSRSQSRSRSRSRSRSKSRSRSRDRHRRHKSSKSSHSRRKRSDDTRKRRRSTSSSSDSSSKYRKSRRR